MCCVILTVVVCLWTPQTRARYCPTATTPSTSGSAVCCLVSIHAVTSSSARTGQRSSTRVVQAHATLTMTSTPCSLTLRRPEHTTAASEMSTTTASTTTTSTLTTTSTSRAMIHTSSIRESNIITSSEVEVTAISLHCLTPRSRGYAVCGRLIADEAECDCRVQSDEQKHHCSAVLFQSDVTFHAHNTALVHSLFTTRFHRASAPYLRDLIIVK